MRFVNKMAGRPEMMMAPGDVLAYFKVDLLRCPFCGGVPALYRGPSPHVVCMACAAEGPVFESRRDNTEEMQHRALVAWNVRNTSK